MSENAVPERRTRSMTMIKKIVSSRTEMLSLYGTLAAKKPFTADVDDTSKLLAEFCEDLIDYTANAHFQLYRYFAENRERRGDVAEIVNAIYPRIIEITQSILDFNDKYDTDLQRHQLTSLEGDLSALGEELAERIELEDRLINVLASR